MKVANSHNSRQLVSFDSKLHKNVTVSVAEKCLQFQEDDIYGNILSLVKETGIGMSSTTSNFLELSYEAVRRNSY